MKILIVLALCSSLVLSKEILCAQSINSAKKDTLYYLIDTAKTLKSDRIFSIDHYPRNVLYSIYCPCIPQNSGFSFYYSTIKGLPDTTLKQDIYLSKKDIRKIAFIRLSKLIEIVCRDHADTNFYHDIYFVEHLPNGKYTKRKVKLQKPFSPEE